MQNAQNNLTEHYSNAILAIQKEKCLAFLTCLRPCIEWLGQILLIDLLGEQTAKDLIAGKIRKINGQEVLPDYAKSLYGSAYFTILPQLYILTHSYKKIPLDKRANCNPRSIVECACESILDAYKTCSQISEHAGNHTMNPKLQAYNYALLIPSFVDKLKNFNLLSETTVRFLDNLFSTHRVFPQSEKKEESSSHTSSKPTSLSPDPRLFLQGD